MHAMTRLMLTTTPGLEDVAAEELAERAAAAGIEPDALAWPDAGVAGRLRVDVPADEAATRALALAMRTAHHASRHVTTLPLPAERGLERIVAAVREAAWPELDASTPFRVTGARHGEHDFSSRDLQVAAGAVLQQRTGAPVDLERYAVNVQVDAIHDRCVIAVRWTDRALGRRFERRFNRRVALKPPVAHALLRLAARDLAPGTVLDPFCGTGTILLEAGTMFRRATLLGSDTAPACVDGAGENLAAAGLDTRARLARVDARLLGEHYPAESVDLLATNPPYGRRLGRGTNFTRLYSDFLAGAQRVLRPGGRLAILVGKRGAFNHARVRVGGWDVRHVRIIDMNHVHAGLFVLDRE